MNRPQDARLAVTHTGFVLAATMTLMILQASVALGSAQDDALTEARANARMGFLLAIGELQKLAGDDRRVTATADLGMDLDSTHGSRHWTGVWSNAGAADEIYTRTPKAKFEGWLVSGASEILSNEDSTAIPLGNGVKLVGAGTAGNSVSEHVTVPLVEVHSGLHNMTGSYGWWVGDEGVKTRGNLPSTVNPTAAATDLTLGERGGGWEIVDGMESYPKRGATNESILAKVFSFPSMSEAVPSVRDIIPKHFHGFTFDSRGLLTDTLNGGLRMDLTPYLENGFPSSSASASFPNAPVSGRNIIPTSIAPNITGPTWDRLRALRTMRPPTGGGLTVSVGNGGDQAHISPILLDCRLLLGAKMVPVVGDPTRFRVQPCAKIAVAFANPYPHTLRWQQNLELEFFYVSSTGDATCLRRVGRDISPSNNRNLNPRFISESATVPSVFGSTTFTIPAGELPPGEARAYTMVDAVIRPNNTIPITVPLGPFLSSGPTDFTKSIQLQQPEITHVPDGQQLELSVREDGNTSVLGIDLRLEGAGTLLRIEEVDLDNSHQSITKRRLTSLEATAMREPVPLYLCSLQISQPGADYSPMLPDNKLGIRNSTLRTFADFNLRAMHFTCPAACMVSPPYFYERPDSTGGLPFDPPGGITGTDFTRNLAAPQLAWGHAPSSGPRKTLLFDTPEHLVSLAQFQHSDLTADDRFPSVSSQPGNALGNSYAPLLVKRGLSSEIRYDFRLSDEFTAAVATANRQYDMSYLINTALWDSYFLSTVPASGPAHPLNPRIAEIQSGTTPSELKDPMLAASQLWVEGAFNVNSTQKEAWKALLASNRNLKHPSETDAPGEGVMFPRHLSIQSVAATLPKPSGNSDDSFSGFRRISDEQIEALAVEITEQVRLRGPFLSLSHFVNRALIDLADDPNHLGRSGALQSAIDNSGLNMVPGSPDSGFAAINPSENLVTMLEQAGGFPEADMVGNGTIRFTQNPASTGPPAFASLCLRENPNNSGSMLADRAMLTDAKYRPEQGFRSTGIPGWLTQADILQVIGPVISVRSDTFRIRAYGETKDDSGKIIAQAWCEAIVQRTPEFLDPSDAPETHLDELKPANAKFGRRFSVISFRWLPSDEI